MEFKLLKKENGKSVFMLKGINPVMANTLRRLIMDSVPTMAVEEITFKKNSSALYDEIIAHRIGLIPLKTDLKSYSLKEKCRCKGKGCAGCELLMTLKVPGPKTVYASDIESKDPKVVPVYPKTPIVKLLNKQALELEMKAVLGEGKDHTKFTPGLVYYRALANIKINNPKNPERCANACPKNVFRFNNGKLSVVKLNDCDLCNACVDMSSGGIEVKGSSSDYIFVVESWGQLSPKEMVSEAFSVLDDKLKEFSKLLKAI